MKREKELMARRFFIDQIDYFQVSSDLLGFLSHDSSLYFFLSPH
jgi:hypothetical protein